VKDPLGDGLAGVPEVALPAVPRDQLQQDCHKRPTHGDLGHPLLYHPSSQGIRRFFSSAFFLLGSVQREYLCCSVIIRFRFLRFILVLLETL
jgi:hypothetical protein